VTRGRSTTVCRPAVRAQQHFQQYNRENGEQPINNGAEVPTRQRRPARRPRSPSWPRRSIRPPARPPPPSRPSKLQNSKDRIWAITVTIQTTDADNPHYVAAKQTILDSLEVRLPNR
jgi:hypothetical protein